MWVCVSVGFVYLGASDENASARVCVGESVCMCVDREALQL